jgi:hypothetical protein
MNSGNFRATRGVQTRDPKVRQPETVGYFFVRVTSNPKGDQIKEDEVGGTCSTHGRDEKFMHFSRKTAGLRHVRSSTARTLGS